MQANFSPVLPSRQMVLLQAVGCVFWGTAGSPFSQLMGQGIGCFNSQTLSFFRLPTGSLFMRQSLIGLTRKLGTTGLETQDDNPVSTALLLPC